MSRPPSQAVIEADTSDTQPADQESEEDADA